MIKQPKTLVGEYLTGLNMTVAEMLHNWHQFRKGGKHAQLHLDELMRNITITRDTLSSIERESTKIVVGRDRE